MKVKTVSILLSLILVAVTMFSSPRTQLIRVADTASVSVVNPDLTHDLSLVNLTHWTASNTYDTKYDTTPAGPNDMVFHSDTQNGDIFYVDVNVTDVTNLWQWQVKLWFDPYLLQCIFNDTMKPFVPPDSPFNFPIQPTPLVNNGTGYVMGAASQFPGMPIVNGSGTLLRIPFLIVQGAGLGEWYHCNLTLDPVETYLNDPDMIPIPSTPEDGYYEIFWVTPRQPSLKVLPSEYKATTLGEDVKFDIYAYNVEAAWEIIGFQVVIRFNSTLLEPKYIEEGTFMEGFVNDGEYVSYMTAHDYGPQPDKSYPGDPGLPPCYNAWLITAIILPPSGIWYAPFPEGEGRLISLHFKAIYETTSPEEAWTDLSCWYIEGYEFYINDNFWLYAINKHIDEIPFEACVGAMYRAPLVEVHDIAITDVKHSETVVPWGASVQINVTAQNLGDFFETFNVTAYANTTIIDRFVNITLSSGNSTTIIFTWNTTGFDKGNYTISVYAWPVLGEADTTDNTFIDGTVYVSIIGDVNADGKVDMIDIGICCLAYGSAPGHPKWNSNADINDDGKVDMMDIGLACMHYGETCP